MGIRSTLASMRMVSYIVRPSRPETHMTAPNGTHFYWVMRRRYMRMRRILGDEAALYADAAYYSQATCGKLDRFGINDQVQRKGYRDHPLSDANRLRNEAIAVTRPGGERPFATYKSRFGLARTRLMGLAKKTDPVRVGRQRP